MTEQSNTDLLLDTLVPKINEAYDFPDAADDIAADLMSKPYPKPVFLVGHTGTGKSSLFEQLAARKSHPVIRVNMNGQTTIADFVGFWMVKGSETVWVDGALPTAMRKGTWLIVDELDFAEPAILSVLNAPLEPGGKLMLKEKGHDIITPHKDFRLLATGNGVGCMAPYRHLYQGVSIMNLAFLDRWSVYKIDYLPPEKEVRVLVGTIPGLTTEPAQILVRAANEVRQCFEKEEIRCTFSTRQLLDWADKMMRYKSMKLSPEVCVMRAAESSIFAKISPEDSTFIRELLQRICISKA